MKHHSLRTCCVRLMDFNSSHRTGNVKNMIRCCVCFSDFGDGDNQPKFLRCLHSFCQLCLQKMNTRQSVTCPLCRTVTKVERGVRGLQTNDYALQLAESMADLDVLQKKCVERTAINAQIRELNRSLETRNEQLEKQIRKTQVCHILMSNSTCLSLNSTLEMEHFIYLFRAYMIRSGISQQDIKTWMEYRYPKASSTASSFLAKRLGERQSERWMEMLQHFVVEMSGEQSVKKPLFPKSKVDVLESSFRHDPDPDVSSVIRLAREIRVAPSRITSWFNHRKREESTRKRRAKKDKGSKSRFTKTGATGSTKKCI